MSYKEENARFLRHKIYVSPTEQVYPQNVVGERRSRCRLLQNIICLIGISILLIFSSRCVYRVMSRNQWDTLITARNAQLGGPPPLEKQLRDFAELSNELVEFSEENIKEFEQFLQTYAKRYSSIEEHRRRFKIFSKNLKYIRNAQSFVNNTVFDSNHFTDQDDDELKKMIMPHYTGPENPTNFPKFDTSPGWSSDLKRPTSFDWRTKGAVMGIKNQEQCGSCWAFAVVGVVESLNIINGGARTKLSEQELLDCDHQERGCSGGYRPYAFKFVKQNGLVAQDLYNYIAKQAQCRLPTIGNGTRVYVNEVYSFDRNESDMADWVSSKGPITIGVNVTKEMFSYRSGVFNPTREDCAYNSLGSHAMVVIGYGTQNGEDYWLLKNSWGPAHGEAGYIRMKRGVNSCGIANSVYSALIKKN